MEAIAPDTCPFLPPGPSTIKVLQEFANLRSAIVSIRDKNDRAIKDNLGDEECHKILVSIMGEFPKFEERLNNLTSMLSDTGPKPATSGSNIGIHVDGCSHEIRTPMTCLFADTKLSIICEEGYRETLESNGEECKRLIEIFDRINFFSDLYSRKPDLLNQKYIDELLDEAFTRFQSNHPSISINLLTNLSHSLCLNTSGSLLIDLFDELLNNANFFGEGSKIEIDVTEETAGVIAIKISDKGRGIASEKGDLSDLFDIFGRPDQARNSEDGGPGLGLAIAKAIAQLHGGDIELESTPGQGTDALVTLPVFESR